LLRQFKNERRAKEEAAHETPAGRRETQAALPPAPAAEAPTRTPPEAVTTRSFGNRDGEAASAGPPGDYRNRLDGAPSAAAGGGQGHRLAARRPVHARAGAGPHAADELLQLARQLVAAGAVQLQNLHVLAEQLRLQRRQRGRVEAARVDAPLPQVRPRLHQ